MNVSGKRVLLTGATGGLGHAIARELAGAGAHVILSGRRGEVLADLAKEISGDVAPADLTDRAAVRDLAAAHTDVDILVSNAGLSASGLIDTWTEEQIDRALDVNLRTAIVLTRTLVPHMVARGEGHIVFMSSLAGKTPTAGSSLYNATKFGLRGFAGAIRAELHGTGVGVSAHLPRLHPRRRDVPCDRRQAAVRRRDEVAAPRRRGDAQGDRAQQGRARRRAGRPALGAVLGPLAPDIAAAVSRRSGGDEIAKAHEDAHMANR